MRLRVVAAIGFLVVLAVLGWAATGHAQSVKLAGGRVEILKVSAGTNHFYATEKGWKGFVAETLPAKALGKFGIKRKEVNQPHGSLALWVREFDEQGRLVPVTVRNAGVVFPDGRYVAGNLHLWASNVVMLELPFYPRVESQIEVRMIRGAENLSLRVKNPAPRKKAEWIGEELPQTNVFGDMLISVRAGMGDLIRFHAKTTNGPAPGWMYWRYEVEDAVGNWEHSSWSSHGWKLDRSKFDRGPLKLTVYPEEYLSAGYVNEPAAGEVVKLEVNARAAALGLRDVFVLGCGEFVVRSVSDVAIVESAVSASEGVRISATRPNAVVMCRASANVERIEARVRERTERREGLRIFRSVPQRGEERAMSNGNVLRNCPIVWERTTNATEVEVIVRHRPVVFYVDMEKAGPKTRPGRD